jgi:hypothetical protein
MLLNVVSIVKSVIRNDDYRIQPSSFVAINPRFLRNFAQKYDNDEDFAYLKICDEIYNNNTDFKNVIIIRPDALAYRIVLAKRDNRMLSHKKLIKASLKIIKNTNAYKELYAITEKFVKAYMKYFNHTIKDLDFILIKRSFIKEYARKKHMTEDDAEIKLFLDLDDWENLPPQEQYMISKNIFINVEALIETLRENEEQIDEELILYYIKYKPSLKLLDHIMKRLSR